MTRRRRSGPGVAPRQWQKAGSPRGGPSGTPAGRGTRRRRERPVWSAEISGAASARHRRRNASRRGVGRSACARRPRGVRPGAALADPRAAAWAGAETRLPGAGRRARICRRSNPRRKGGIGAARPRRRGPRRDEPPVPMCPRDLARDRSRRAYKGLSGRLRRIYMFALILIRVRSQGTGARRW